MRRGRCSRVDARWMGFQGHRRFVVGGSGFPSVVALGGVAHSSSPAFGFHKHGRNTPSSFADSGSVPSESLLSGPASERLQIVHDRFKLDLWETLGDGGAHLLRCVGI